MTARMPERSIPVARSPLHAGPVTARRVQLRAHRRASVTHELATVLFVAHGHASVDQRGHRWTVTEGDAFLVPPAEPHRWVEAEAADCWELGFCVQCFRSADGLPVQVVERVERVRADAAPVVRIPEARRPFLTAILSELVGVTARDAQTDEAVVRSLLTLALNEVSSASRSMVPVAQPGIVAQALAFIERNCLRRITLAEIARAVGRSPAHVTTALRRATGRSAGAWIAAGRMAEARRLLLHSDMSLQAIAGAVGYGDLTHFIRVFRSAHEVTPAAWRRARAR